MSESKKTEIRKLTDEEERKIRDILDEYELEALGFGNYGEVILIGARNKNHKKIVKQVSKTIKDRLGIDTKINL